MAKDASALRHTRAKDVQYQWKNGPVEKPEILFDIPREDKDSAGLHRWRATTARSYGERRFGPPLEGERDAAPIYRKP